LEKVRKAFALSVCVAALVLSAASPASAQKDPFDPLITENGTDTGDTTAPTDPDITVDPDIDTAPPADEPMPGTGADPSRWIGLATLAIALGAGLLLLGWLLQPARKQEI
jgi:hypothetical protein